MYAILVRIKKYDICYEMDRRMTYNVKSLSGSCMCQTARCQIASRMAGRAPHLWGYALYRPWALERQVHNARVRSALASGRPPVDECCSMSCRTKQSVTELAWRMHDDNEPVVGIVGVPYDDKLITLECATLGRFGGC